MTASSSKSKTSQQCFLQGENNFKDENINSRIQNTCDQSSLNAIKRQMDIHKRLYERYTCGEISRNNIFCRHLDSMRETRKNLLKQLERMDMKRMPLSS